VTSAGDADVLLLLLGQGEDLGDVVEALGLLDGEDALRAELPVDVVDEDARRRRCFPRRRRGFLRRRRGFLRRLRKGNGRRGDCESRRLQERASFQGFLLDG
jgi:hypothetical protein